MKQVFSILAMVLLTLEFFSCTADSNMDETSALYESVKATDGDIVPIIRRDDPDDDDEEGTDGDIVIIDRRTDDDITGGN
ncbi:hypothetical protein [Zeaxanthinibacter enoshimensis]|uniref:Secreted protein n=1 Tax=Zeaxanthinibacter enoshimensis TaxID=392009 RepID=A0A4R6TL42_9FLAO|nr:hypothetical protein [Zeaxanthinibacter enoshimensis]TDQ31596.1 hypothetical protein CLV82_2305 [Zeaxanthinibacter enoshimensis]